MKAVFLSMLASFAVTCIGCYVGLLPRPTTAPTPSAASSLALSTEAEPKPPSTREAKKESPITHEVFAAPAPQNASTDSRVLQGGSASEALGTQLHTIRTRLSDLKAAYDARGETEGDLLQATDKLKHLAGLARNDCDLILRVARDQKAELPHHKRSYESTAEYYREKGRKYKTKEFQSLNLEFAEKFERLAEDIPRRRRLTDAFIEQLIELQDFLAETERCLADTKVALSILSIGTKEIKLSGETKHFRQHLETFLTAVDEYQRRFFEMPSPPSVQPQKSPDLEKEAPKKDSVPDIKEERKKPPIRPHAKNDSSETARQNATVPSSASRPQTTPRAGEWMPASVYHARERQTGHVQPANSQHQFHAQRQQPTVVHYQEYHCNGVVYLVPVSQPTYSVSCYPTYSPVYYAQPGTTWRTYP